MKDLTALFENEIKPTRRNSLKRDVGDYIREYGIDVHLDKPVSDTTSTGAVFVKGDRNSSMLKMNLFFANNPMNLNGYTVTANIKEGCNKTITIPATVESDLDGVVIVNLPSNVVDEEGLNTFELTLQKNDKVIVTHQFSYTVFNSLGEGEIEDEQELTLLQNLIQQVQQSKNTVDDITQELEINQSDIDDILGMVGGLGD